MPLFDVVAVVCFFCVLLACLLALDTSLGNTFLDSVQLEFDNCHDTVFTDNTYDAASTTIEVKNTACFEEEDASLNAACSS